MGNGSTNPLLGTPLEDRYRLSGEVQHNKQDSIWTGCLVQDSKTHVSLKVSPITSDNFNEINHKKNVYMMLLEQGKPFSHPFAKIFDVVLMEHTLLIVEEFLPVGLSDQCKPKIAEFTSVLGLGVWTQICLEGSRIARALDALHGKGMVHGNLCPAHLRWQCHTENHLVLTGMGSPMSADLFGHFSLDECPLDDLGYLSPEQTGFTQKASQSVVDIYGLGVCLYEWAACKRAFEAPTVKEVIVKILGWMPPPLSELFPGFPKQLSEVIQKCFRKNPKERYQSALGLAADLEECMRFLEKGDIHFKFALGKKDKIREINYQIPLIGRFRELGLLQESLVKAVDNKPQIQFLGAPSGGGKSKLVYILSEYASRLNWQVLNAKFSEYESNVPFSAVQALLQEHLSFIHSLPSEIVKPWKETVSEKMESRLDSLAWRFPFVSIFFGKGTDSKNLESSHEVESLIQNLAEFLFLLPCGGAGIFIFLDDLQWADHFSLKVIQCVAKMILSGTTGNFLLLGTFRDDEVSSEHFLSREIFKLGPPSWVLKLPPLTAEATSILVEHLLDERSEAIMDLASATFRITGGNPFFISEYVKHCIQSGDFFLESSSNSWKFKEKSDGIRQDVNWTAGLFKLIETRVARLEDASQLILKCACVLGSRFYEADLEFVSNEYLRLHNSPVEISDLRNNGFRSQTLLFNSSFGQLIQEHFLVASGGEVQFYHDKILESVSSLLSAVEKKRIHQIYAGHVSKFYLEQTVLNGQCDRYELLEIADHFVDGMAIEMPKEAFYILKMAGKKSTLLFSFFKAKIYLKLAIDIVDQFPHLIEESKFETLELYAGALALSEDVDGAIGVFEHIFENHPTLKGKIAACAKLVEYNLALFKYPDSLAASQRGMELLGIYLKNGFFADMFRILVWGVLFVIITLFNKITKDKFLRNPNMAEELFCVFATQSQVPRFFVKPVEAVGMQLYILTRLCLHPKGRHFSQLRGFWGVFFAVVGLHKLALKFHSQAASDFVTWNDPVLENFFRFDLAYLSFYPQGKIEEETKILSEVIEVLEPLGETFWRTLSLQALIHAEHLAPRMEYLNAFNQKFKVLCNTTQFEYCIASPFLKTYLLLDKQMDAENWVERIQNAVDQFESEGTKSIDWCYASDALGEYFYWTGDLQKATVCLKKAFWGSVLNHHRVAHCLLIPCHYAKVLLVENKAIRALFPLFISWLNALLGYSLVLPFAFINTGSWFYALNLHQIGRWFYKKGTHVARTRGWYQVLAEAHLEQAKWELGWDAEEALLHAENANRLFSKMGIGFFAAKAQKWVKLSKDKLSQRFPNEDFWFSQTHKSSKQKLKSQMEAIAFHELIISLSDVQTREELFNALLASSCASTGAQYASFYQLKEDKLLHVKSHISGQMDVEKPQWTSGVFHSGNRLEMWLQQNFETVKVGPFIFQPENGNNVFNLSGSIMAVPLGNRDFCHGVIIITNEFVNDLFDARSAQTIAPLVSQALIVLKNLESMEAREEKARLEIEIMAAKALQDTLLPSSECQIPNVEVCYLYQSATTIGGDWLNYFHHESSNSLFCFIGDVTGHGFPSALMTGVVSGAISSYTRTLKRFDVSDGMVLQNMAKLLNGVVFETGKKLNLAMTMAMIHVDLESGRCAYLSAGHTPILWRSLRSKKVEILQSPGSRLGVQLDCVYELKHFQMSKGDMLFFHTDGLTEQMSPEGKCLSVKAIGRLLSEAESVLEAQQKIKDRSLRLWKGTALEDDCTYFTIQWHPPHIEKEADFGLPNKKSA